MTIRHLSCLALLLFLAPSTDVLGQDLQRPAEWRVRTDDPAADAVAAYARMPDMEMDGQVGLRVHDEVDVHITRLDVVVREEGSS